MDDHSHHTDVESLYEQTAAFHGHECPGSAMGLRAGLAALEALGTDRAANKELRCTVDSGPAHPALCFVDGVQMATGCTYGKGNLEMADHGKNALTLTDTASGRRVRVSLDPGWFAQALEHSPFIERRKQGVEPMDIDPEITDAAVEQVLTMPADDLLQVGEVEGIEATAERTGPSFDWQRCGVCGEVTFQPGLRVVDGEVVCETCAADAR